MSEIAYDTLIHGDYHTRNLFIDSSRSIIGICDWEQARMAPRAYEIARSVHYICFSSASEQNPERYEIDDVLEHARKFIDGYREYFSDLEGRNYRGLRLRYRKLVCSSWIEEAYYEMNDPRSLIFVPHEMRLIREFAGEGMLERLL